MQNGFQQNIAALFQAVLNGQGSGEDKVQGMGVELKFTAVHQGDLHVCYLPAQSALVQCQGNGLGNLILISGLDSAHGNGGTEGDTAATGRGSDLEFQNGPAGLGNQIGNVALTGLGNGLPVNDGRGREGDLQIKPGLKEFLQNFQLNGTHDAQMKLIQGPDVLHLEQGILSGQNVAGLAQGGHLLRLFRNGLDSDERGAQAARFHTAGEGSGIADDGTDGDISQAVENADLAGGKLAHRIAGGITDLGYFGGHELFLTGGGIHAVGQGDGGAVFQHAAVKPHPDAPAQGLVLLGGKGNTAEAAHIGNGFEAIAHGVQKGIHAFIPEGGTPENGIDGAFPGQTADIFPDREVFPQEILLHQRFICVAENFCCGIFILHIHTAVGKKAAQLLKNSVGIGACTVSFVQEEDHRNVFLLQSLEQQFGLGLHTGNTAHDDHRCIQCPAGALDFCGKVHVTGGVNQVKQGILMAKIHAGCLDGNAPAALHGKGIGMGGAGINGAGIADGTGVGKQPFGQGGFACVNVGQHADTDVFFGGSCHCGYRLSKSFDNQYSMKIPFRR